MRMTIESHQKATMLKRLHAKYLKKHPIILTSESDAISKVKEYFPTFDDSDEERHKKGVTIEHLRRSEYKAIVERECRRHWLYQSIEILIMLLDSGRLKSEYDRGLRFDLVEQRAHLVFIKMCTELDGTPEFDKEKIKWDVVDMFSEEVDLYFD